MYTLIEQCWYQEHWIRWILLPFSWVYRIIVRSRRWLLSSFFQHKPSVPVIVVGNLTVGGVGKTPLVIELAKQIKNKGLKVGIISRGYGSNVNHYPYEVSIEDCASKVGDEPLLIAKHTGCPVVIAPRRVEASEYLCTQYDLDILISDDGLQHYRMGRSIEILVVDGQRGMGNGLCLPAGPLREPVSRLEEVDLIVVNEGNLNDAYTMKLIPGMLKHMLTKSELPVASLTERVAAVAGIGNPQRFLDTLTQLGIQFNAYLFPDHYQFRANDLHYAESAVVMTEKDAVKCQAFVNDKMYYLPVQANVSEAFWDALWQHEQFKGLL